MLKGANGKSVIECHPFDKDKIKLTDHGYNVLIEIKLQEIKNEKYKWITKKKYTFAPV